MEEPKVQDPTEPSEPVKKACQITLMFPIKNDKEAYGVKEAIDIIVEDIKEKRYNFSISEA